MELQQASLRVPKAAEHVAAKIRRQIVTGELPEGTALPPEAELVARYGVSRPTLREAFRILESENGEGRAALAGFEVQHVAAAAPEEPAAVAVDVLVPVDAVEPDRGRFLAPGGGLVDGDAGGGGRPPDGVDDQRPDPWNEKAPIA